MPFLWVNTSNRKVGQGVPTAYAGATLAQARASCLEVECSFLGCKCYAWIGTDRLAFGGMIEKAKEDPQRYELGNVLRETPRGVTIGRLTAIGDPGGSNTPETLEACGELQRARLLPMVYTHGWRRSDTQALRRLALASCDNPGQALEALRAGWVASVVAPWDRPYQGVENWGAGWPGLAFDCPAQLSSHRELRRVTCDQACRRCSPSWAGWTQNGGPFAVVIFRDHGPKVRHKIRRARGRRLALAVTS